MFRRRKEEIQHRVLGQAAQIYEIARQDRRIGRRGAENIGAVIGSGTCAARRFIQGHRRIHEREQDLGTPLARPDAFEVESQRIGDAGPLTDEVDPHLALTVEPQARRVDDDTLEMVQKGRVGEFRVGQRNQTGQFKPEERPRGPVRPARLDLLEHRQVVQALFRLIRGIVRATATCECNQEQRKPETELLPQLLAHYAALDAPTETLSCPGPHHIAASRRMQKDV